VHRTAPSAPSAPHAPVAPVTTVHPARVQPLKASLKRGVLVTAANWQVVVIQFVADALFKTLLAVPIVGGVFLAVLLVGGDPIDLLDLPVRSIIPTMTTVLLAQPLALGAFLFALTIVLIGGSMFMFLVKGGTVTVLAAAERGEGAQRLFKRYVLLGAALLIVYGVTTIPSLFVIFAPPPEQSGWGTTAVLSLVIVAVITVANALYLLLQMVVCADDCTVPEAVARVARLLRVEFRNVGMIFGATLVLLVLTTAASILATAALGLIAFVPLIGLAALPLQLIAWIVRGLVFEFLGVTALVAYLRVYRIAQGQPSSAIRIDRSA
jgi:hypothetical protein